MQQLYVYLRRLHLTLDLTHDPTCYTREVPSLLAKFLSTVLEMKSLTHSRYMTLSASLCGSACPSAKQVA
jgi:hypothetical protein